MMKLAKLFLLLICAAIPGAAFAQETTLKSGESIDLRISGVPSDEVMLVSQRYGISDSGTIVLPYLKSPIKASGKKPSALARIIEAAYRSAQIYTQPTIQVSADAQTTGASRFLSIMGEVKAPTRLIFTSGMTIFDAIAQCGGFTDFADKKKIKLTRGGKVTYHDLRRGDPKENIKIQANDLITVKGGGTIFKR